MAKPRGQTLDDVNELIADLETEYGKVMTFTAAQRPGRTDGCHTHSFDQSTTPPAGGAARGGPPPHTRDGGKPCRPMPSHVPQLASSSKA